MKKQITLPSGSMLELDVGSFDEVSDLIDAITAELKIVDISGLSLSGDISGGMNAIKNGVLGAIGSKPIRAAMFKCAGRCILNGQRITKVTFEPYEARKDYVPTAWEVIQYNVNPFIPGGDLSLLIKSKLTQSSPLSE